MYMINYLYLHDYTYIYKILCIYIYKIETVIHVYDIF